MLRRRVTYLREATCCSIQGRPLDHRRESVTEKPEVPIGKYSVINVVEAKLAARTGDYRSRLAAVNRRARIVIGSVRRPWAAQ